MDFITEDRVAAWVESRGGVLHTRKISNLDETDLSKCPPGTLVCLTGYAFHVDAFFKDTIGKFPYPIILVTIECNGSGGAYDVPWRYLENNKLAHWFLLNKPFHHEKLSAIPLGLNHDRQAVSLRTWMSGHGDITCSIGKDYHTRINKMLVNFENTYKERPPLLQKARTDWSDIAHIAKTLPATHSERVSSETDHGGCYWAPITDPCFYTILSSYRFILSPRGEGEDCHRTWEALYVGTIPIVKSSSIDELFEGLPVIIVQEWSEITSEFLERKYQEFQETTFSTEPLTGRFWLERIEKMQAYQRLEWCSSRVQYPP